MSVFAQAVVMQVGINIILAFGYWIAVTTGQFSFGHAGFMAVGAYTASILTLNLDWSLPVALIAGAVLSAVAGALIGFIALRLSLLYLAIVTLVFAELVDILISQWSYVGGGSGLIGMTGTTPTMVVVVVLIVLAFLILLSRSRLGLAYRAIRDDTQAAMASGIRITLVSVGAFAVSAAVTGVAGGLSAHQTLIISPSMFDPNQSLLIILFVVLGGVEYFWGAAVGAIVLSLLPIYFSSLADWYQILYGVLFVVLMIVRPQGLIGRTRIDLLKPLRFLRSAPGTVPERSSAATPDDDTGLRKEQTVG